MTRASVAHAYARPGFALPLVVMVALVVMLTLGVVLSRNGSSHYAIQRRVAVYRDHHRDMGMQEILDRWLATTHGAIAERLGPGGLAFELDLPYSTRIGFYMTDGQGTALEDTDYLYGLQRTLARRLNMMLEQYAEAGDEQARSTIFRPGGPAKVSVNTAPDRMIQSIAQAAAPEGRWDDFARELLTRRARAPLTQADIRTAAQQSELTPEEVTAAEMLLTADPTVWHVHVVITSPGAQPQEAGALIEIAAEPASIGRATKFLHWEAVHNGPN